MATFSPLRAPAEPTTPPPPAGRPPAPAPPGSPNAPRSWHRFWWVPAAVLLVGLLAGAFFFVLSARASISADGAGLARIGLPLGGGRIVSVSVVGGREHKLVAARVVDGDLLVAKRPVAADEPLQIRVVIRRPGWISWADSKPQTLTLSYVTPAASSLTHYLTVAKGAGVRLRFKAPIEAYEVGSSPTRLTRHVLRSPTDSVPLPRTGAAGTVYVAAQIHRWERSPSAQISYFPAGRSASALADPAPGTSIKPATPIRITFSRPVDRGTGPPHADPDPCHQRQLEAGLQPHRPVHADRVRLRPQRARPSRAAQRRAPRRRPVDNRQFRQLDDSQRLRDPRPAAAGRARLPAARVQIPGQGRPTHTDRAGGRGRRSTGRQVRMALLGRAASSSRHSGSPAATEWSPRARS